MYNTYSQESSLPNAEDNHLQLLRFKEAETGTPTYVQITTVTSFTKNPNRPWWNLRTKDGCNFYVPDECAADVQILLDQFLFRFSKPIKAQDEYA